MAIKKGNDGVVKIGTAVVTEVTAWSYDDSMGVVEKPVAMGDVAKQYVADGVKAGSGSIEVIYDHADASHQALVPGATIALVLNESGTAVGSVKHTGSVVISSVSKSGGGSDFLKRSISFSGVLTEGVN